MNPWQVAFVVLQVVFTLALTGFLLVLKMFYKDVKHLDGRIADLEKRQEVDDAQYKFIQKQLSEITKNIEKIFKLITKRR